jgi:hypothetical protein
MNDGGEIKDVGYRRERSEDADLAALFGADFEDVLRTCGWNAAEVSIRDEIDLAKIVLAVATRLGIPMKTRRGCVTDKLSPVEADEAIPSSLSSKYGLQAFPFHVDGAHWPVPPKYVVLGCLDPGENDTRTLLVDRTRIKMSSEVLRLARRAVFWVRNGRKSFYATVLETSRDFIRFDPGCMEPQNDEARRVMELLSFNSLHGLSEGISWKRGKILVFNNWRVLHARDGANQIDKQRILIRTVTL